MQSKSKMKKMQSLNSMVNFLAIIMKFLMLIYFNLQLLIMKIH